MITLNQHEVQFESFPNGETRLVEASVIVPLKVTGSVNEISFKYESDADLMKLFFLKRYIDQQFFYQWNAELLIYYMPYSRMDRSENGSAFTLKYVADFINSMGFNKVRIIEPHSEVTQALIDKVQPVMINTSLLPQVVAETAFDLQEDYLFYPDAGAQKRYAKEWKNFNSLVGYKNRDFETGRITDFSLVGELPAKPFKAIIVDDLSSYGGTFLLSAEHLRKAGATEVYLLVAHAEESILRGNIFTSGLVDKVFSTDSIISPATLAAEPLSVQSKMKIYPVEAYTHA